jgi:LysM repeat protein
MTTQDHDENDNFVMRTESEDTDVNEDQEEDYYLSEGSNLRKPKKLPWIVGAVVLLLLVVLFFSLFGKDDNSADMAQLKDFEIRIVRVEEKLDAVERLQDGLTRIEKQEKTLANLLVRFDNLESGMIRQMTQLKKELAEYRKKQAKAAAPQAKTSPPPAKPEKKAAKPKFHEVRAGETLYGISRNAGLTLEQLRSYNKLAATDTIRPGQKLKLTPP